MYLGMTFYANWGYVQNILFIVTSVVMIIFCNTPTDSTMIRTRWTKKSSIDKAENFCVSGHFLLVPRPSIPLEISLNFFESFGRPIFATVFKTLFRVLVIPFCYYLAWSFSVFSFIFAVLIRKFLCILFPVGTFTTRTPLFSKIRNGFNLIASYTLFCYDVLSHIRSSVTGLIRATFGRQPVCGLFYYTGKRRYVNEF